MNHKICFSYLPDASLGIRNQAAAPPAGHSPEVPGGRGVAGPCFSYTDDVRLGDVRRMPEPSGCFSYQE